MIVKEYRCDSTLIRIDDKKIEAEDKNEEIMATIISSIMKKISEYS